MTSRMDSTECPARWTTDANACAADVFRMPCDPTKAILARRVQVLIRASVRGPAPGSAGASTPRRSAAASGKTLVLHLSRVAEEEPRRDGRSVGPDGLGHGRCSGARLGRE